MILVKAKLLRCRTDDRTFEDKTTRHYIFECQKTDLDGSIVPAIFSTKNLDVSKVLEAHLSDKQFHLIPINNGRVNAYSMNGTTSFVLDDSLILHPEFASLDDVMEIA
jgi:hypothetical protein